MSDDALSQLPAAKASLQEIREARARVAISNPEQLRKWLEATRPYLIFHGKDLMDALDPLWPDGVRAFQDIVNVYRAQRIGIPTGETRVVESLGHRVEQTIYKDDGLTLTEKDRCVRWLISQILEAKPDWRLEDPSL